MLLDYIDKAKGQHTSLNNYRESCLKAKDYKEDALTLG
jgi:hypothetical protein